eukprot:762158-Hanusia_phi.AAC.5
MTACSSRRLLRPPHEHPCKGSNLRRSRIIPPTVEAARAGRRGGEAAKRERAGAGTEELRTTEIGGGGEAGGGKRPDLQTDILPSGCERRLVCRRQQKQGKYG